MDVEGSGKEPGEKAVIFAQKKPPNQRAETISLEERLPQQLILAYCKKIVNVLSRNCPPIAANRTHTPEQRPALLFYQRLQVQGLTHSRERTRARARTHMHTRAHTRQPAGWLESDNRKSQKEIATGTEVGVGATLITTFPSTLVKK